MHGYGIYKFSNGGFIYGQRKENELDGYAYTRFNIGWICFDYDGQFKEGKCCGEGIETDLKSGIIERVRYEYIDD